MAMTTCSVIRRDPHITVHHRRDKEYYDVHPRNVSFIRAIRVATSAESVWRKMSNWLEREGVRLYSFHDMVISLVK
jgi:ACT domain-containing protein